MLTTYFLIKNIVDILFKKKEKKKIKSKMRFEDDQVSDLARRCENVNICRNENQFSNQISIYSS